MTSPSKRFSLPALLALLFSLFCAAAWADPPGRVGRLAHLEGEVWWSEKYEAPAEDARRNWPVTNENVVATGDGRAEIRIGSLSLALDRDTEVEFARLDDERVRVRLLQGRMAAHLRSRDTAREFEVSTPFGRARTLEAGRYRFAVDRDGLRGAVTVFDGHARFDGEGPGLAVREGETLRIEDGDGRTTRLETARRSEFDDWHLARDGRGEGRALRYVPAEMTGYEDLDDYGDWREVDDYGAVWIPRGVSADWAPYREGRWAWVEPWGWTWIDDMPWGFAPFHYGRWMLIGGLWAWIPGRLVARPAYSPALVVWLGSPGLGLGLASGPVVGWFPLGPREIYVPAYKHSRAHLHRINHGHVHRIEHVDVTRTRYVHRDAPRAVTVVAAAAVGAGRPVHREALRVRERSELWKLPAAAVPRVLQPEPRERRRSEAAERWRERHRVADRGRDPGRPADRGAPSVPAREQPAAAAPRPERPGSEERDRRRDAGPWRAEERRQAGEERRIGEERQRAEDRLRPEARQREDERQRAEDRQRADDRQRAEERRRAEERQRSDEARRNEERRRIEDGRRREEGQRLEERLRLEEKQRQEARQRVETQRRAEEERRAQEQRRAEDERGADEERRRAREQERAERERRWVRDAEPRGDEERRRGAQEAQRRMQDPKRQDVQRQWREVPRPDPGAAPAATPQGARVRELRRQDGGSQDGRDAGGRSRRD